MIAPRMAGLICCHSTSSALVTVTKSLPKKTPVTPPAAKMRRASGDFAAASAVGKSAVPASSTVWPGRNFSVAGFGVDSVWMNMGFLRPVPSDMRPAPPSVKARPLRVSAAVGAEVGIHLFQRGQRAQLDVAQDRAFLGVIGHGGIGFGLRARAGRHVSGPF